MGVSTDETSRDRTDQFIQQIGFKLVVDDPGWSTYAQFGPGGSAARYVIINGVADSPSHRQWEVLFNENYFDYKHPEILRALIDGVKPPPLTAPVITVQPQSQTVSWGATVTLNLMATGGLPLSYQWKKSGVPILGATNQSLVLPKITTKEAGDYIAVVSNSISSETSDSVTLTVIDPVRPTLSGLRRIDDNSVEMMISGEVGRSYRLEFSADFKSWKKLAVLNTRTAQTTVRDATFANSAQGFYRIVLE